jgi:hypothetical protein
MRFYGNGMDTSSYGFAPVRVNLSSFWRATGVDETDCLTLDFTDEGIIS